MSDVMSPFLLPASSLLSEDEQEAAKVTAVKNNKVLKIIFFISVAFVL